MAAVAGHDVVIEYDDGGGYDPIAGARVDRLTFNNEVIDITDKTDAGVRTLLDDVGMQTYEITVSGVMKNAIIMALAGAQTAGTSIHLFRIVIGTIGTVTGSFSITNFEAGGEYGANAADFSCTLTGTGLMTMT